MLWHRIYSTNIDDVIHNAYAKGGAQRLETIVCPASYTDPDPWMETVQFVQLHGSVLDASKPLTFTVDDLANQTASPSPWYQALVEDMQARSTIFVGTSLSEPPFFHYLAMRGKRIGGTAELRAKAFLVSPQVSRMRTRQLSDHGIVVVHSTAEEFFAEIAPAVNGRVPDRLSVLKNRYPHQIRAIETGLLESQSAFLKQFELVGEVVGQSTRSQFFLGAEPTWHDISSGADAERQVYGLMRIAIASAAGGVRAVALVGQAGSGKSTALRRLALEAARAGATVYFLKAAEKIDTKEAIAALSSAGTRQIVIFVDDAALHAGSLQLISGSLGQESNVTFVMGERPHVLNPRLSALQHLKPVLVENPPLNGEECAQILAKLEQFGYLGKLKGRPHSEQLREFLGRSRKQLLVAMKEATSGRGFDAIIAHEFFQLASERARLAYTVACLAYDCGAPVRIRHLLAVVGGTDIEAATVIRKELDGVLVPWKDSSTLVSPRHRVIAHQWHQRHHRLTCVEPHW